MWALFYPQMSVLVRTVAPMADSRDVAGDSAGARRARYGGFLRRSRGDLTQRDVAAGSGVPQAAVSRAEAGGPVPEEHLVALEGFLGAPDDYPAAPRDPVRRREWFDRRNLGISRGVPVPASGCFGRGDAK